jgi:hypothetical protein
VDCVTLFYKVGVFSPVSYAYSSIYFKEYFDFVYLWLEISVSFLSLSLSPYFIIFSHLYCLSCILVVQFLSSALFCSHLLSCMHSLSICVLTCFLLSFYFYYWQVLEWLS